MLHYRRVASLVLGAWIASSLMTVVVIRQLRNVEHVFVSPAPEHREVIGSLKTEPLRQVLRYHAWEESRNLLYGWGVVQLALGPLLAWLLLLSMRVSRLVVGSVGAIVVLACFNQFVVGPEMTYAGRALDFDGASGRGRYLLLNGLFMGLECVKIGMCLAIAWYLFTYRSGHDTGQRADSEAALVRSRRAS